MSRLDRTEVVKRLASRGYNVEPAAVEQIASAPDPDAAIDLVLETVPGDALKITEDHLPREWAKDPSNSTGDPDGPPGSNPSQSPNEIQEIGIQGDVSGRSTGTGDYEDFVKLFRDRYERLSRILGGRVSHRTARSLEAARGGREAEFIGLVTDVRSTRNGHTLVELEDTTGTIPVLLLEDRDLRIDGSELLHDEVIGVTGRLADDGGILFAESVHVPDVPRTITPSTADRPVEAALVSDVHVGSKEFLADAWGAFTDWLRTEEAEHVEYLLIAGDMVEGVGVYPGQDADLEVIDIYEQYEEFANELAAVPDRIEIVMIPGNHDAVRLAEPQPAIDEDLLAPVREVKAVDVVANPSLVTIESVSILMYHGASLDELIRELPQPEIEYDAPERVMTELLRRRHLAPPFGGGLRIAPEERDYLVIEEVPDVFHAGHVHTIGVGQYHGIRVINSGCWQSQTEFQRRNNLDPDPGIAPILDLQTLDVTLRKFH